METISEEDYYRKTNEFRRWLKHERNAYLDELKSSEAHRLFRKFVRKWNRKELADQYYTNSAALTHQESTRYKWNFVENLPIEDLDRLERTTTRIQQATERDRTSRDRPRPVARADGAEATYDREGRQQETRYLQKKDHQRWRDRQALAMEEVLGDRPAPGSREAKEEKRRVLNQRHREFGDRELDIEYADEDLMGPGDDFMDAKRRMEQNSRKRMMHGASRAESSISSTRLAELKAREDATMAMFKKMAEKFQSG